MELDIGARRGPQRRGGGVGLGGAGACREDPADAVIFLFCFLFFHLFVFLFFGSE